MSNQPPVKNGKAPSRLGKIKSGRVTAGTRFIFYGGEGVGKSTLAAHTPAPIFIDVEGGTNFLDVDRYTFDDGEGLSPKDRAMPISFAEVIAAIVDLTVNDHPYKTLVIDTVDQLEPLIWNHCLARDSGRQSNLNKSGKPLESIESYGYGKGYIVALDEWRNLCRYLDRMRTTRGIHVVLLGHCHIRLFKNPEGEDYDRFQMSIKDNAGGFLKGWSDVVGFCAYEGGGAKMDNDQRAAKGYDTGRRLVHLERTAAFDAKSRLALPKQLVLAPVGPWKPMGTAIARATNPKLLAAAIGVELERLGDAELTANVNKAVKKAAKNPGALGRYLGDLSKREPKEEVIDV